MVLSFREIIRLTGAVIIIKVKALVEEITAVMVEALVISLKMQQGKAVSLTFAK